MSVIENSPSTINFLSPLNFHFYIKRTPNLNFWIQSIDIPDIAGAGVVQPNPFVDIFQTSDHLFYSPLNVTFKVDEKCDNYLEVFNWLRQINFPSDHSERREIEDTENRVNNLRSELMVLISNSNKIPKIELSFTEAFPVSLSGLKVVTTDSEVNYVTASASFKFTSFFINKL